MSRPGSILQAKAFSRNIGGQADEAATLATDRQTETATAPGIGIGTGTGRDTRTHTSARAMHIEFIQNNNQYMYTCLSCAVSRIKSLAKLMLLTSVRKGSCPASVQAWEKIGKEPRASQGAGIYCRVFLGCRSRSNHDGSPCSCMMLYVLDSRGFEVLLVHAFSRASLSTRSGQRRQHNVQGQPRVHRCLGC